MTFEKGMLIDCRKAAGWTQQQLADKSGCHVRTVKYWEARNKVRAVKGHALQRMRDVLANHGVTQDHVPELKQMEVWRQTKDLPVYCGAIAPDGNPLPAQDRAG